MMSALSQFHWLRPEWLLGIIPALALCLMLWKQKHQANNWQQFIAPELLKHLLDSQQAPTQRRYFAALLISWLIACLAMAGPTWEKLPQPVYKTESALIILLDLSPSMVAEDLKPSRIIRARHKLIDILQARKEGLTALIAYGGEAHVVSPLTDDTATIESILPALHPNIMPLRGSNTEMAIDKALALFKDAGITQGRILLVTDGVETSAAATVANTLEGAAFTLSILGSGTDDGAPIPTGKGAFAKDTSNGIVIARLYSDRLRQLSQSAGGRYADLQPNDRDLEYLDINDQPLSEQTRKLQREFDTWHEQGHWLALLLLPVVALCFRRGLVVSIVLIPLLTTPSKSYALSWDDLWLTPDQQGQKSLQQDNPGKASTEFKSPDWRGTAQYKAQDFEAAAESFSSNSTAEGRFNLGNALAKAGKLKPAIEAYQQALEQNPDFEDARFNQEVVKKALEQQQQQKDKQDQQENEGEQESDGSSDQQQGQSSDDMSSEQQSSEQQSSEQQSSEQQQEQSSPENQQQESSNHEDSQDGDQKEPPENQDKQNAQNQNTEENESSEEQAQAERREQSDESTDEQPATASGDELSPEQQQALEQWLRKIPDDPGGLLRKKFQYQYRQRRKEYQAGTWEPPENNANKRW